MVIETHFGHSRIGAFWAEEWGKLEGWECWGVLFQLWACGLWAKPAGFNPGGQEQVRVNMSSPQRMPFRTELHWLQKWETWSPFLAPLHYLGVSPKGLQTLTGHSWQFNILPFMDLTFMYPFLWLSGTHWQYLPASCHSRFWTGKWC